VKKAVVLWTLAIFLGSYPLVHAQGILDHQNGQFYAYDVSCWDHRGTMVDLQRYAVIETARTGACTLLYDRDMGTFYEIRKTGPATYVGLDYATGAVHEFQVGEGGTVSVCDTETGECLRFTGNPM
jgi:hypothetical protein